METIAETAVRRCQRKFNVRRAIRLCHKMINFVGSAVIQLSKQQKINFMPKCPNCPKQNPPTANVCIGRGHPLQVQVSPVAELRNNSPTLPPQDGYDLARHLADQINQSVAKLKSSPPPTKLNSFVAGVISIPTLGLGFLVAKFFGMLGRFVEPPKRIKLALRLVLAKVEQGYKTETEMKALFEKSRNELQSYEALEHQSTMYFVYGIATSIILCITIPLVIWHSAKTSEREAAIAVQRAAMTQVERIAEDVKSGESKAVEEYTEVLNKSLTIKKTTKVSGIKRIAVIASDSKHSDPAITESIVKLLQQTNNNVTGGLFSEVFITSGLFEKVFNSDIAVIKDLNLAEAADEIVLIKKELKFSERPEYSLKNISITLNVKFIDTATGEVLSGYTFDGSSEAFSASTAESSAVNQIIGKITESKINPSHL